MNDSKDTKDTKPKRFTRIVAVLRWFGSWRGAWLNFRLGMARRKNAQMAIDTLEARTMLTHSPLQKYNVNQLKKLARRHGEKVAIGARAEIERRKYVGKHRNEIFLATGAKPERPVRIAKAAIAVLALMFVALNATASGTSSSQGSTTDVPFAITSQWFWGLIGFLGVIQLLLMVVYYGRKVFGKKPPIHEEMSGIHKKIYAVQKSLEEADERLRENVDERFRDLQIERQRTLAELNEKMGHIATDVAFMRGKISNEA